MKTWRKRWQIINLNFLQLEIVILLCLAILMKMCRQWGWIYLLKSTKMQFSVNKVKDHQIEKFKTGKLIMTESFRTLKKWNHLKHQGKLQIIKLMLFKMKNNKNNRKTRINIFYMTILNKILWIILNLHS